jgi:hypothetical protein
VVSYDLLGLPLWRSYTSRGGRILSLGISPDGRLLVSGGDDQIIRLLDLNTGQPIAALFFSSDSEWVLWTPQGYYTSSANGDRATQVGIVINRGKNKQSQFVTLSQLKERLYRPEIVERALALRDPHAAVRELGAAPDPLREIGQGSVPTILPLTPRGLETSRGRIDLPVRIPQPANNPISALEVYVNEVRVEPAARPEGDNLTLDVPLVNGDNRVRIVARNDIGQGETRLEVRQNGEGALDKRDTLYVLAIGVDRYPTLPPTCGVFHNQSCDLTFAGADARAFAETVEKRLGAYHKQIVKRVLYNGVGENREPTRTNIEDAMDVLRKTRENDTVAVFIAGHGENHDRDGYLFLPTDSRPGEGGLASSSVIKWQLIEGFLHNAKGRRMLFADTCRSGNAYNARLIKDASDGEIVAFSATNKQQDALEFAKLQHGIFTHVLLRGLEREADLRKERTVRVFDLAAFVESEVRNMTQGRQTPDFYKKPGADNFVLVRLQ